MTFDEYILQHETTIRLSFFFGVLGVMALWEILAPRRALTVSKAMRWVNNLGLVFLNSIVLRLIFPAAAGLKTNLQVLTEKKLAPTLLVRSPGPRTTFISRMTWTKSFSSVE